MEQHAEIDALNRKHGGRFRMFKGIEANIRADGSDRHGAARDAPVRVRRRLAAFGAAEIDRPDRDGWSPPCRSAA